MTTYTEKNTACIESSKFTPTYPPLLHKLLDYHVTEIAIGTVVFAAIAFLRLHR